MRGTQVRTGAAASNAALVYLTAMCSAHPPAPRLWAAHDLCGRALPCGTYGGTVLLPVISCKRHSTLPPGLPRGMAAFVHGLPSGVLAACPAHAIKSRGRTGHI